MVTLTGYIDTYPFGSAPDPKDSTGKTQADLEPWGGWGFEPALSFHPAETIAWDLYGTLRHTRASGSPGAQLAWYTGGGTTVSWLFLPFLEEAQRPADADYRKEGFLPGLVLGVSGQLVHCDGKAQCAKSRTTQLSATPFLDVRVKPQLQVRFSVPIGRYEAVGKDGVDVAPTLSLAAQIGAP